MTTNDFKKRVEELGYGATGDVNIDVLSTDKTEKRLAYVSGYQRFSVYIFRSVAPELFDLIVEYARTPIEERKDEKKYRLRLTFVYSDTYLMRDPRNNELYVGTGAISRDGVFTASEVAKIEEKYNLGSFEREEVIEDE